MNKVFVIGLSKTGTVSITDAFARLGYKCSHFPDHLLSLQEGRLSIDLEAVAEWDMLADVPVVVFYQELDEAYPGSKFILTTRGTDAWLKSCANHFDPLALQPDGILTAILLDVYGCIWYDADRFARAHREHVADVTEYFRDRPNDLLVLDVNAPDKWLAICEFVGVDVPDRPYPKSNVSIKLPRPLKKLARLARIRLYWPLKRALGLTYPARFLGRGRPR